MLTFIAIVVALVVGILMGLYLQPLQIAIARLKGFFMGGD